MGDDLFTRTIYAKYLAASIAAIAGSTLGQVATLTIAGGILGSQALSVISLSLPFYYLFTIVGAILGVGGAQVCAHLIGWQRYEDCRRAFSLVYVCVVLFGVALSLLLLPLITPLLRLIGTSAELIDASRNYLTVLCLGGTFIIGIYPAFNMLRLDGQSVMTALLFVFMGLLHIAFGLLFLLGFGAGVEGLALAMCIAYALTSLIGAWALMRKSLNFRFTPLWRREAAVLDEAAAGAEGEAAGAGRGAAEGGVEAGARASGKVASEAEARSPGDAPAFSLRALLGMVIRIGSPSALTNGCGAVRSAFINGFAIVGFGAVALASYAVVNGVLQTILIFVAGVSGSAMPFLAVFFAEKDPASTRKILRLSFLWGIPTVILLLVILEFFAPMIAVLFGARTDEETAAFSLAIRLFALGAPLLLLNYVLITLYQAQGSMFISNAMVFTHELAGPLLLMLLLMAPLGVVGIWIAFPIAELLTTLEALAYSAFRRSRNAYLSRLFLTDRQIESEGRSVSFVARNSPVSIMGVVESVTGFCAHNHLSSRLTMSIQLALEEMLVSIGANSLKNDPNGTMSVRVLLLNDEVVVRIRNGGLRFNPLEYAERLSGRPLGRGSSPAAGLEREAEREAGAGLSGASGAGAGASGAGGGAGEAAGAGAGAGAAAGTATFSTASGVVSAAASDVTGILMVLAMATTVDYRSTFGANNLMIVLSEKTR
jgi:Na+-driven multidrug efflux pump/anti-sigma regulatory factor (Ser/Thr protein kinase)